MVTCGATAACDVAQRLPTSPPVMRRAIDALVVTRRLLGRLEVAVMASVNSFLVAPDPPWVKKSLALTVELHWRKNSSLRKNNSLGWRHADHLGFPKTDASQAPLEAHRLSPVKDRTIISG